MSHLKKVRAKMSASVRAEPALVSSSEQEKLALWGRQRDKAIPSVLREGLAKRAKAVLLLANPKADRRLKAVAAKTGLSSSTVMRLRDRVTEEGIATLVLALRHGRRIDRRTRANLKAERSRAVDSNGDKLSATTRALALKHKVSQSTASRWLRQK